MRACLLVITCKSLVQLCFRIIIQEQLDEIKAVWNSHRIRPTRNPSVPSGIPEVMYIVHSCGVLRTSWFHTVTLMTADRHASSSHLSRATMICNIVMSESVLTFPSNLLEAQEFYLTSRDAVRSLIFN
ncbi:hypothetical protein N1851_030222 [Merluccius polli]|uniref:Secreted protein n=1 Tax=Merluccius polli TaxID=89951 RepID=A0AA47NR02_MERPO|nr:hypothetical protein N1851_030222 [Merluccius polli]